MTEQNMFTKRVRNRPEKVRAEIQRGREEASEAFSAELHRLMEQKGVEDLGELYLHYVETEHAYIPVPGLHRGKTISFEEFKRHAARRHPYVYREFLAGLVEALGLTEEEARDLSFIYLMGEPRQAYHEARR